MAASTRSRARPPRRVLRAVLIAAGLLFGGGVAVLTGFRVASLLRETRSRAQAAPPSARVARAGGLEVYYQESGPVDGPTVLLVHGTGAWSEIWRGTMQVLSDAGFRCIALDLPPFGFSERPVPPDYTDASQASRIVGLLDALEIRQVTLVGHSFGARPTVEAALRVPNRVQALVLIDGALGLQATSGKPPLLMRALLASGLVRDALVSATLTNPMLSRRLLRLLILDPADATESQVRMIQQQFTVRGTSHALGGWLERFVLSQDHSMAGDRAEYSRLGMPTLVVWGEEDSITPLPQARDLMTVLPNAELVVLRNAGHIPLIEDGPALNHALLDFLKRRVFPE
jgi:pimeloyl-ACP methyl ester carboxylesterase